MDPKVKTTQSIMYEHVSEVSRNVKQLIEQKGMHNLRREAFFPDGMNPKEYHYLYNEGTVSNVQSDSSVSSPLSSIYASIYRASTTEPGDADSSIDDEDQ